MLPQETEPVRREQELANHDGKAAVQTASSGGIVIEKTPSVKKGVRRRKDGPSALSTEIDSSLARLKAREEPTTDSNKRPVKGKGKSKQKKRDHEPEQATETLASSTNVPETIRATEFQRRSVLDGLSDPPQTTTSAQCAASDVLGPGRRAVAVNVDSVLGSSDFARRSDCRMSVVNNAAVPPGTKELVRKLEKSGATALKRKSAPANLAGIPPSSSGQSTASNVNDTGLRAVVVKVGSVRRLDEFARRHNASVLEANSVPEELAGELEKLGIKANFPGWRPGEKKRAREGEEELGIAE